MSEDKKPVRKPVDMTPAANAALIKELGVVALNRSFGLVEKMIESGKTDLIQGYGATIMSADLMHSAGLLSDQAYGAIFIMSSLMEAVAGLGGSIGAAFGGNSPFAPSLKTLIQTGAEYGASSVESPKGKVSFRAQGKDEQVEVEENEG